VAGVLGGLGHDVKEHAPGCPALAGLEPGGDRQRLRRVQVDRADELVGAPGRLGVAGEDCVEGLAR